MMRAVTNFLCALACLGVSVPGIPATLLAEEVKVTDLKCFSEEDGRDKVCFVLKPLADPKIFSIEGENPRIVLDIPNVHSWAGKPRVAVNGRSVQQVRTHLHRAEKKLRIVLDLVPSRDYTADPIYYEAKGIYCISVSAK